MENMANNSLNELNNRYKLNKEKYNNDKIILISIYEFIKNNYKDKLLFYSMNHPSKYTIQYICEEIINILQIKNTINYDIDELSNPKSILYKTIQKNVNFDITKHMPFIFDKTNIREIAEIYYTAYKKVGYN